MLAVDLTPDQSEQLIYSRFRSNGFPDPFAKLLTAQSGHESNGWTSDVYLEDNNAFGYGYTGSGYDAYNSVEANIDDLTGYIGRKVEAGIFPNPSTITDADQWAGLLKQAGYYTDTEANYSAGITRWLNDNLALAGGLSLGIIILAALVIYGLSK